MELVETLVVVVHVLAAAALIGLVLLQQGKGADMGASLGGGASQTLFGSEGGGSFLARMTAILATVFFCSSFALAVFAKQKADLVAEQDFIPEVRQELGVQEGDSIPSLDEAAQITEEGEPEEQGTPELE